MYKRVFLDANVLVDVYDLTRATSKYSSKVVKELLYDDDVDLFTSCDIVTTIYYLRAKQDKKQALEDIIQVSNMCQIIEFGNKEVIEACSIMQQNSNFTDLEDTIQYVMAKKVKADLIISNDETFYSEGIELLNARELCTKLRLF